MKYIFMFVNDYLSLENLSTIDFMLMIQIFIRIIIMFVQLLVALLLYLILSLPLFLPLPLLLLPLQLFLALPVSLLHVVVLLVPLPLLSPQLYVVVCVVVLFYRFFCWTCQGSGRGCVEGPQFHLQHFQIFSNANATHQRKCEKKCFFAIIVGRQASLYKFITNVSVYLFLSNFQVILFMK